MSHSESKSPAEVVRPQVNGGRSQAVNSLAERIESAVDVCHSPREFLEYIVPMIREHFGSWLAVATMPHRSDLMAVDSDNDGSLIDPELIRLQLQRSGGASNATTIRLADGRGARSLQVAFGDGAAAVGIGIVHFPDRTPDPVTQLEQLRFLSAVSETAFRVIHSIGDSQLVVGHSTELSTDTSRLRLREFHRSLDTNETALTIASESAWLVDCDRVCVLLRDGGKFRLKAVTGVDVIDRRGNESKRLELLTDSAIALHVPLIYPSIAELPPQIEVPLGEYLDQSLVQSGVLIPIFPVSDDKAGDRKKNAIAAIAFERFRGQPIDSVTPAMRAVCEEALLAFENSRTHQSVFLLPVWKTAGYLLSPAMRYKTVLATLLVAAMVVASLVVQVDYKVTATGSVEPATVRNLFASADGVVSKLHVNDGDYVAKGDVLIEIENAELRRQSEEIEGGIHTSAEKLAAIDSVLVSGGGHREKGSDGEQMMIERRQLQTQLASLKAQQAVVVAEQERQSIRSPLDGQIVGWRLSQRLEQRPVSRGHRLFSVVDTKGPQVLKLQVPDRDGGTVLEYSAAKKESMSIDFILATEPDRSLRAEVIEIATSTRLDSQGLNMLDVLAKVEPGQEIDISMGSEVTAGIHCGRRSLLSAWFGDVASFYHRRIRFYFS